MIFKFRRSDHSPDLSNCIKLHWHATSSYWCCCCRSRRLAAGTQARNQITLQISRTASTSLSKLGHGVFRMKYGVRSRATEKMLSSLPSSKIDWSAFAVECKNNVNPSVTKNIEATMVDEYNTHSALDLERKQDGVQLESAQSDSPKINLEQNQVPQANFQQTEVICAETKMGEGERFQLGTVRVLTLSVLSSVSIVICNKALMSSLHFIFATTLTSWHLLVTFALFI